MMAKFAEEADRNGNVPCGVFWITANGKAEDVMESLATFAEKIHGQKMHNEDRVQRDVVEETIGKGLSKVNGRWFLCVDNIGYAGQPDVNAILGALTSMARRHGWIIITSRTKNPRPWMRMMIE